MTGIAVRIGAAFVGFVLALVLVTLSGCGGTALRMHAIAATASAEVLSTASEVIEDRVGREMIAAARSAPTEETARAAAAAVEESWGPVIAAHEAAAGVHDLWIDVLRLAAEHDLDDPMRWANIVVRLMDAWDTLVSRARERGLQLPGPPSALVAVVRAVGPPAPSENEGTDAITVPP